VPLLLALAKLVAFVPLRDLPLLGAPLAWLAGGVLRIRRSQVEAAMRLAGVPEAAAAGMYRSLATGVMELLWLAGAPRGSLAQWVTIDPASRGRLDEALRPGRGAVIGASHTGNWELTACAMARFTRLSVLVKRVSVGAFDRFMRRVRTGYGVGLLEGRGALSRACRELEVGRAVALLIDQVPEREEHGDRVPFLGAGALVDRAPATLAAALGVPFIVTASLREADGRHALYVLSVKLPPARGRRAWAGQAMREATEELAAFVMAHPDQWLWLHRRWNRPPVGGVAAAARDPSSA